MDTNTVVGCGSALTVMASGRYELKCWHRTRLGAMKDCLYTELTWQEAIDTLLAEMAHTRPGWAVGADWSQPSLPFD